MTGISMPSVALEQTGLILGRWRKQSVGLSFSPEVSRCSASLLVVIALDLSRSMGNDFDPSERIGPEDEEDPDERAQAQAKERFFSRRKNIGEALPKGMSLPQIDCES